MTTPTWILERNVFSEECFYRMVGHFKANDIPYHIVTVIPFAHTIDGKVPVIAPGTPVVAYGSVGIQKCAEHYGWKPGVFTGDFYPDSYTEAFGQKYLNHDARIWRIADLISALKGQNAGEEFFAKPNDDFKAFAGQSFTSDGFIEWYNKMLDIKYLEENPDFEVITSSEKELGHEYRFVIVDGFVTDASCYKAWRVGNTKPIVPIDAYQYVTKILKYYPFRPAPVYIMDIAETDTFDGYQIVECGTFNSAGLYACNVGDVIDRINFYLMKQGEMK